MKSRQTPQGPLRNHSLKWLPRCHAAKVPRCRCGEAGTTAQRRSAGGGGGARWRAAKLPRCQEVLPRWQEVLPRCPAAKMPRCHVDVVGICHVARLDGRKNASAKEEARRALKPLCMGTRRTAPERARDQLPRAGEIAQNAPQSAKKCQVEDAQTSGSEWRAQVRAGAGARRRKRAQVTGSAAGKRARGALRRRGEGQKSQRTQGNAERLNDVGLQC